MIEVRVLGPLEVSVDGAAVAAGGPRQRCVLARLAAARGQVVSADRLIEDLYAGEAPQRALAAVQSYVSHLRRILEPRREGWDRVSAIAASPPGYVLRLGRDAVDAWVFEDEVHRAAAQAGADVVYAGLSAALAAWRGTAYQEFAGLPWADLEAARLEEVRLAAAEARAGAALRLGHAAQLIAELDRLTAEHPLREEGWRLLALALYQAGRQGDALAALRRARARLAEELGVDPGPALRSLEEDILAQAPHLAAHATVMRRSLPAADLVRARGGSAPQAAVSYVGRDAELARVLDAAGEAAAGRTRVVLVAGEAGAGKTALADWLSLRLAADGWAVAAGRCSEHEGAPAGWPWAQALRRLASVSAPADPQPLARLLTDTEEQLADVPAARFRLHRAVAGYLNEAARAAPLLVVLDDLHWADSETLAILNDITADLTASRLLILAAYRPGETAGQLSECLAVLATREPLRVTLRGLGEEAAGELIRATCTRSVDEATARAVGARVGGNPFFIKETARLLDSEGALAAATGVPAGVREVLQRRTARLPATAQTVLRAAAVIGAETDADVLRDVADVDEQMLLDAVEAGLIAGLVTEPRTGLVRFAHALVRDTLYESLSRLRRSRLHHRAAEAIERRYPGEVASLAYHFTAAGTDPLRAARYCGLAAVQAEQQFAYREAVRLWEQAIACLDRAPGTQPRDRLEPALGMIRSLSHAGELSRARALRNDAMRSALPLDDPVLLAHAIAAFDVPRGWFFREYGETDEELVATVEGALARLPPGDHPLRCRLLTTLAFELEGAQSERGYLASDQAIKMARRLGDPGILAMAIAGRWHQSFRYDGFAERQALGAELLALPDKPVTVEAGTHLVLMMTDCGIADFEAADRHADAAARIAGRYNLPTFAALVSAYRAVRAALSGDLAGAEGLYQQAGNQMKGFGVPAQQIRAGGALTRASLLIMQDKAADIVGELDRYAGFPTALPELYALGLATGGRVAEARATAGRLSPVRHDRLWQFFSVIRALLAIAVDDRDEAACAYQSLLPFADRLTSIDAVLITLGPVAQTLGDLARYLGHPDAEDHYRRALAIAERADAQLCREAAIRRLRKRRPLTYAPAQLRA